jgi:hypothetical protein
LGAEEALFGACKVDFSELEMYPDYLVYDEIKRRESEKWQPIPLELPLYQPYWPDSADEGEDEEEKTEDRGVLIIDLIDYSEVSLKS